MRYLRGEERQTAFTTDFADHADQTTIEFLFDPGNPRNPWMLL
jgi:hypothetical protein